MGTPVIGMEEVGAMRSGWKATRKALGRILLAGVAVAMLPVPAVAQDSEARLRKIEAELRALQRTVFPGGDGRYFAPEVDTSQPATQPQPGLPATSALADVLARLDALEGQLARLTARGEENANELAQLRTQLNEVLANQAAPAPTGVIQVPPAVGQSPSRVSTAPASSTPASSTPASRTPASTAPASTSPAAATPARAPSPQRVAAVQAIAKPVTEDPGDDEYSYGFRLWEAGFFPEAQQQLALFLEKYPRHARASFGKNLLGRAFFDNGQPREAATHFFDNYQADRQGARAGDSLLYLAEAMIAINDTNRACIALAEFGDTYPALASGRLKEQYDRTRNKVTCR
jgi:TolA-binding protein